MKKFLSFFLSMLLTLSLSAQHLNSLDNTSLTHDAQLRKAIQTFGVSKSVKIPAQKTPSAIISMPAIKKASAGVITLSGEGFLVGPEFEAATGEWYVACEAQGYTFRLCWYGTEDDFTGTFDLYDIDMEDSWGWYQSADSFYEIYYADVTMTVSEKTVGSLKQIIVDATIVDTQDRTYQLHVVHNTFTPKETVKHTINNGELSFGLGQYMLKGNNADMNVELVVNSEVVDGVFTNPDLDLNHTKVSYKGVGQQLLQTNLSVMPATFSNGVLGYDVDFAFFNQDTVLHQVSMPTPLPKALDTIEVKCTNLQVDDSFAAFGFIMLTGDNADYDIFAMYEGTEIVAGVYQNVAVTINDKITWQPVESITATLILTEETDGWHANIETYAMDYNWYSIDMSFVVPTPTKTIQVTFDKPALATYNPGDDHTIQLLAVGDEYEASVTTMGILPGETFTMEDVLLDYSGIYNCDAEMTIQLADITGSLRQNGDTTFIYASAIGFNAIQYDVTLWYVAPTPVDTIDIEMPVKFTNALQDGYYTLSAYTPDNKWYVALSPITHQVAGTFVNDGVFGKFGAPDGRYDFFGGNTFIYSEDDMANYPIEKGTLTVDVAEDGSTIVAVAEVIARNAICYRIKMTSEYNEHLDFDEPETEIDVVYTTQDNVTIDDQTEKNGYIYLALTAADGLHMAAFFFYVEQADDETIVPVGTYPIDYSGDYGTVQANPGVMGDGVWPSFYAEMLEDGSLVTPLWLLIGGTVEVSKDESGAMHLEANAYNSYGVPVHIVYDGTATAVEDVTATGKSSLKVLRDGQLFIIRDGKCYNVLGAETK